MENSFTTFTRLNVLRWFHLITAMCREPLCLPEGVTPCSVMSRTTSEALPLLLRSYRLMRQTIGRKGKERGTPLNN